VFVQMFEGTSGDPLTEASLTTPEEAPQLCAKSPLLCVGSGGAAVAEAALRNGREADSRLPTLQPDARNLARMASSLPVVKTVIPLYLRPPDAKPQIGKALPRAQ